MSKYKKEQGTYYIIPTELVLEGKPTKALLYGLISSLTNERGYCFASNLYLTEKLGKKDKSIISKYITELQNEGWIIVEYEKGNKRKIWLIYKEGIRKKPMGGIRKKPYRGIRKKPMGYKEKTLYNNISNNNIIKEKDSKAKNSFGDIKKTTEKDISERGGKRLFSSVDKTISAPRKILDENDLRVFAIYKKYINPMCKPNYGAVIEGIPRAIKEFNNYFRPKEEAILKLIESIIKVSQTDTFKFIKEKSQSNSTSAKRFFSLSYIQNTLLTLTIKSNHDGKLCERPQTDEELRKIQEANQRERDRVIKSRQKRNKE